MTNDPFQTRRQQAPQAAAEVTRRLRDTGKAAQGRDKLTAPRKQRVGKAIQMMDVLTAGDEALNHYLEENSTQILQRVEEAKADMELAETPEEAELFRPDPMDELLAQMLQVVSVREGQSDTVAETAGAETFAWDKPAADEPEPAAFDLELLKASLMAECQTAIMEASLPTPEEPEPPTPEMYLADCGIVGCSIHSIDPASGRIIHHFEFGEVNTPALREAERLLHGRDSLAYVEVYKEWVCAVTSAGAVTKYPV